MSRAQKVQLLQNIASTALMSHNQAGLCREVAKKILIAIGQHQDLSGGSRSVLTIYYQDKDNTAWDHSVASVTIPDRVVIDARLHFLRAECEAGPKGTPKTAFVGSLTDWQRIVERMTNKPHHRLRMDDGRTP